MKRSIRRTLAAVVTVLMIVGLFAGCSGNSTSGSTGEVKNTAGYAKDEYNLVFIPKLVHEWYEEVKQGIDKAVAELKEKGVTVNYTWDAPADAIVTEQISKIESAAAKKPDAISVAIIDASATTTVINDLVAQGMKICTFDCDAVDSNRLYYCGHSTNYEDGKEMANRLAKALNEEGEVAVLAGTLSAINHQERVQGFKDGIAQYPKMKIVDSQADNDSIETALSVTESYLAAYPNLKGLIGVNAASPIGAARAVKDAGKSGKIQIVGMAEDQEAMQFVKEGTMLCTLRQAVPTYGYNSVFNMLKLADGKDPEPKVDEIPAYFVTKENVDDFLK